MNFVTKFATQIRQQTQPAFSPAGLVAKFVAPIRQHPYRRSRCAANRPADTAPYSHICRANLATDGASSPKFSTIRQNALRDREIRTPLFRQQIRPQFGPAQFAACVLIGLVVVALNLEQATEFSPDALMFRSAIFVGEVRVIATGTWSTPLLDEAREKNPMAVPGSPIRWSYVHGNNMFGRPEFANGDAKAAYRLFRSGTWDDVLSDPENKQDEIVKRCVSLMREMKYGEAAEFLYDKRLARK